jgi:hypothetical protein
MATRTKVSPCGTAPKGGCRMPAERDQCQAKLDIMIEAFMRDDWTTYRVAAVWLRDFAHQKNIERGRVMYGGNWFMPQKIETLKRARRDGPARP